MEVPPELWLQAAWLPSARQRCSSCHARLQMHHMFLPLPHVLPSRHQWLLAVPPAGQTQLLQSSGCSSYSAIPTIQTGCHEYV
jgi:hypothetical protein